MPTRNVNLTDELEGFALAKVKSGRYENASEVVRAALRVLEDQEPGQPLRQRCVELPAACRQGLGRTCYGIRPGLRRMEYRPPVVFYASRAREFWFPASCISGCYQEGSLWMKTKPIRRG